MSESNNVSTVMDMIENLYTNVTEAWGVPLGNDKCIVDREAMISLINDIKAALPEELAEAKRLVSARDEFIGNAKREAESIRKNAEDRAREMLEQQEIVKKAKAMSDEMVSSAEYKSKELRRVANEYVDGILNNAEEAVASALQSINLTRLNFRNLSGAATETVAVAKEEEKDESFVNIPVSNVEQIDEEAE